MSSQALPYPSDHEIDLHSDLCEERRRRALQALDIGDVLATFDDLVASQADPTKHPCFELAEFYADRRHAVSGTELYDRLAALVKEAIEVCVTAALVREE